MADHLSADDFVSLFKKPASVQPPRGERVAVFRSDNPSETITRTIAVKPVSLNHAYASVVRGYVNGRPNIIRVPTSESKVYKAAIHAAFHGASIVAADWYRMRFVFHGPMFYKNGNVRRLDASNCVKLTEDAVMEALGLDDYQVQGGSFDKVDAPEWAVEVSIFPAQFLERMRCAST